MTDTVRWTEEAVVEALRDWARRYREVPTAADWDRTTAYRVGGATKVARLVEHPAPLPHASTVIARFGSWKAAIAAAGLQARSITRRLDAQVLNETVALYRSGLSTVQVAERLEIAPKTVRDRLHAAGVTLRPPRTRARRVPDSEQDAAVLAAARQGTHQRDIAAGLRVPVSHVRDVFKRHHITGGPLVRTMRAEMQRLTALELTDRQRTIIDLVVAQRLTQAEAADRLGIDPSTVQRHLKAAAARLRPGAG